jgi:hypothetical protein
MLEVEERGRLEFIAFEISKIADQNIDEKLKKTSTLEVSKVLSENLVPNGDLTAPNDVQVMISTTEEDTLLEYQTEALIGIKQEEKYIEKIEDKCDICCTSNEVEMVVCQGCKVKIHPQCCDIKIASCDWKCERCSAETDIENTFCIVCHQSEGVMKKIKVLPNDTAWAHPLCIQWDTQIQIEEPSFEEENQTKTYIYSASKQGQDQSICPNRLACFFCHQTTGRIESCRRIKCDRHFHARCGLINNGRIEKQVLAKGIIAEHFYCDRHQSSGNDLDTLFEKLLSTEVRSKDHLSEVQHHLRKIKERIEQYESLDALIKDILDQLVIQAQKKSIQVKKTATSENTTNVYNMNHLQMLQVFLDYIPQFRLMFPGSLTIKLQELIPIEMFQQMIKHFNPQRSYAKVSGPVSQAQPQCQVCQELFGDRQHVFYCLNTATPHAQHWKCTKRKANINKAATGTSGGTGGGGGPSAKKKQKTMAFVQNGQLKEIKIPKALPIVAECIICGICREDMDMRTLAVSKRETNRIFDRPESRFANGGCYVNQLERKGLGRGRPGSARSTTTSAKEMTRQRRGSAKAAAAAVVAAAAAAQAEAAKDQASAPQKFERLNVQRTTKWMAITSYIIKNAKFGKKNISEETNEEFKQEAENSIEASVIEKQNEPKVQERKDTQKQNKEENENTFESGNHDVLTKNANEKMLDIQKELRAAPRSPNDSLVPFFEEAKKYIAPYDPYALNKFENAEKMIMEGNSLGTCLLRSLTSEYTRLIFIKHTRAKEKASNQKKRREQQAAVQAIERERKRADKEAEMALKKQMLAMRKKHHHNASSLSALDTPMRAPTTGSNINESSRKHPTPSNAEVENNVATKKLKTDT